MWEYTDKVKDHFFHPRNVGEIEEPDGVGEVGSLACGDALKFTFKLDENGKIADAKFKTFGCGSAVATSSVLTEMVKGLTLEEAGKITNKQIAEELGGLPEHKMHCSVMGREALEAAIAFYNNGGVPVDPKELEGDVVCNCFGVTEKDIVEAVTENGLVDLDDVMHYTKAGGACGHCKTEINEILQRLNKEAGVCVAAEEADKPLTMVQKIKLIEKTLDEKVRPALQADGGDIELVDIVGDVVQVKLKGMCSGCPASANTLKGLVQVKLQEYVTKELTVEAV